MQKALGGAKRIAAVQDFEDFNGCGVTVVNPWQS